MEKHLVYVWEREAEHYFDQFFVHCEIMYVINYNMYKFIVFSWWEICIPDNN
jgi:hypothetical protein